MKVTGENFVNELMTMIEGRYDSNALTNISYGGSGVWIDATIYINSVEYDENGLSIHYSGSFSELESETRGVLTMEESAIEGFEICERDSEMQFIVVSVNGDHDLGISLKN